VANELIAFDQTELRMVFKALKNMVKRQTKRPSANQALWPTSPGLKLFKLLSAVITLKSQAELLRVLGLKSQAVSVRLLMASLLRSSQVEQPLKTIWGGTEFGSNKFRQFPVWSGREGRGSKGWFIYPTLRRIQPQIVAKWTESFDKILKEWG
jgi:hypothetical protein